MIENVEAREIPRHLSTGISVAERDVRPEPALVGDGDALALDAGFVILESCHSTWLFDPENRRFCRILKVEPAEPSVATDWRPYHRLVVNPGSDAFVVFLDPSGTRLLRSWRHTAHCDQCGGDATAEMSLEDLRRVARA